MLSLANGVVGVLDAAALSIHAIGRGYAHATGMNDKHGVKQTDRLLSNPGIDMWMLFLPWVEFVVAARAELVVALDWTEFDADDHATLAAYLVTSHGRATPLIWMTVTKSTLEGKRNDYEYRLIERLHECVAADVAITVLADRGFGDQKLYGLLQSNRPGEDAWRLARMGRILARCIVADVSSGSPLSLSSSAAS